MLESLILLILQYLFIVNLSLKGFVAILCHHHHYIDVHVHIQIQQHYLDHYFQTNYSHNF